MSDGGISPESAKKIIESSHRKFKEEVFYKIVNKELSRYFQKSADKHKAYTDEEMEKIVENIIYDAWKRILGSFDKDENTIYKGPGDMELKENSLS